MGRSVDPIKAEVIARFLLATAEEMGATLTRTVLHVFLEPAGWFAVWFGLDQLFYGTRELAREHAFYRKMAHADVVFTTYPEEGQTKAPA